MIENDVFEQTLEQFIANIVKTKEEEPAIKEWLEGQESGYRSALMTYRDCKASLFSVGARDGDEQMSDTIKDAEEVMDGAIRLMAAKNADYGDSWRLMRGSSITDQILVKAHRIRTIEESDGSPKVSEGVESEYRDILNYCVFALLKLREVES